MDGSENIKWPKWEYLVLDCRGQSNGHDQLTLNDFGKDGWELVGLANGIAYLKRKTQ